MSTARAKSLRWTSFARYKGALGRFQVIEGGKPKATRRRHALWAGCHVCEADTGIRTTDLVQITAKPEVTAKGQIVGGHKGKVCLHCLLRGKVTPHS